MTNAEPEDHYIDLREPSTGSRLERHIADSWKELPTTMRLLANVTGPVRGEYGDDAQLEQGLRQIADAITDVLVPISAQPDPTFDLLTATTVTCQFSDGSEAGRAVVVWSFVRGPRRVARLRSFGNQPRLQMRVEEVVLPGSDADRKNHDAVGDGNAHVPLSADDIEVFAGYLPPERLDALREWIEPLVGQLDGAIQQDRFEAGSPRLRRAELDRDVLRHELWETDPDDLRPAVVVQHAFSVIETLTADSDDPAAELAARIASAPTGTSYGPDDAIAQRDAIADETGMPPNEVDKALWATSTGLQVTAALAGIYGAYEAGGEAGVLLGAAVAVVILFAKAKWGQSFDD